MNEYLRLLIFLLFSIPVTIVDIKEKRIPDILTAGGIFCFTVVTLLVSPGEFIFFLAGCAGAFTFLWIIWYTAKGKLGFGDVKYSIFIAAAVGFTGWLFSIFTASAAGLIYFAVRLLYFKKDIRMKIPFAPFLTGGCLCFFVVDHFYPNIILRILSG